MNALSRISPLEREYEQSRQNFDNILGYLDGNEAFTMSHSELERELEKKGRELMRVLLQEHLDKRGPGNCEHPVKDADGVARKPTPVQPRKIETVFGTVLLERAGYGLKGTESLHPLDAELNLPDERYSLELRRRIAIEAAKSSFLAVGTPVTWCPPHSPGRAVFPHPVLRLYSLSRELMPYANTLC